MGARQVTALTPAGRALARNNLERARDLLEEVVAELNVETHGCECCGLRVADNYEEFQLARSLEGVAKKLTGWRGSDALLDPH